MTDDRKPLPIFRSSEAVRRGHPDKLCDYLADSLLDKTPRGTKCAFEVMATGNTVVVGGEMGETDPKLFSGSTIESAAFRAFAPACAHVVNIVQAQSEEIAGKVDAMKNNPAAGDMGLTYGYAEAGTYSLLPPSYEMATRFMHDIDANYRSWDLGVLADGKCIVSSRGGSLCRVVMALQAEKGADPEAIKRRVELDVINPACQEMGYDYTDYQFILDCEGFVKGGIEADTGLTGRKIQNDSYGTLALNGGGSFSGKDMTKVDRSGAYYARFLARKIIQRVAKVDRCEVALDWQLGGYSPHSIVINTFGSGADKEAWDAIGEEIMFLPEIISRFTPKSFADYSNYGHFTHMPDRPLQPWEQ